MTPERGIIGTIEARDTLKSVNLSADQSLKWIFESPGLLQDSVLTPKHSLVSDSFLRALLPRLINVDKSELNTALQPAIATRRLGRIVEGLTAFAISKALTPSRLDQNVPVRSGKRTIGELDLLFDDGSDLAHHWELSVKYYICLEDGSPKLSEFMGTFVEDRLDRKLFHLFRDQLPLVATAEAREELERRGWTKAFESRALMKGLFFYPASGSAWRDRSAVLPPEISPEHERGWWTTSRDLCFPRVSSGRYVRLGQLQWLSRFEGAVDAAEIMTHDQLQSFVKEYFAESLDGAWLRRRELTVAEVESVGPTGEPSVYIREVARGHIVHGDWPALAQLTSERSIEELAISSRENSKRPQFSPSPRGAAPRSPV